MTTVIEGRAGENAAARRLGRDWRLLWSASVISTLGDGAFLAALPLVASTMTTDPRLIAGVTAWGTLPWLLAALPAGALVDRTDSRRCMVTMQILQALLVATLALLTTVHAGGIAALYAVAFAVGLAETVAKVGAQKLVPAVVAPEHLERANGRQNAALFAAQECLGPPLGTLLLSIATPLPFWADVASFAISATLVAGIATQRRPAPARRPVPARRPAPAPRRRLSTEIVVGVRWLFRHELFRTFALLAGVANLANFMAMATLVLFARQRLGLDARGYGLLLALMALGGVAGSLLSRRILARLSTRAVVTTTVFTTPIAMLAVGLFAHDLPTMAALTTVTSFGASLWNVATGSLRQRTVPAELLGRVSSAGLLMSWGAQPLGAVLGGLVASWLGLAAPWLLAGTIRLVAAGLAVRPLRRWRAEASA
jgi:MFS family permease